MRTLVAMIRGINVAGHNKVRMSDLRALVAGLGYRDVTTYIQSGNVVLTCEEGSDAQVARSIAGRMAEELGMDVSVVVRSSRELAQVVDSNPYVREGADDSDLHVTFLADVPEPELVAGIDPARGAPHTFRVFERDIYLFCQIGRAHV